jgi:hypothetical protein
VSEYDHEPIRGLPGDLPAGETILWQGTPDWRVIIRTGLHFRLVLGYFGMITAWAIASDDLASAAGVAVLGCVVAAMLALFAWGVARTTVYTLTNRRVVLRIGVALNKCVNIPLSQIETAMLKPLGGGHGSIALMLKGVPRLGYLMLWPHVRSLRIMRPQPMLRAIPEAAAAAALLTKAAGQVQAIAPAASIGAGAAQGPARTSVQGALA